MAVYGVSFYGIDPYGPTTYVDFSVGDFVAEPVGFDAIDLHWRSPRGTWDRIRVLRNRFGFSVDEQDGEILADTPGALSNLTDPDVVPGAWHYYSIWILSADTWYRAGIATTLMLQDHGYGERMFESLPMYHRYLQGVTDDLPPIENETLRSFLKVLGSGLDYIKTYYNTLRLLNDPMRNHIGQLEKLAAQLGINHEPVTPPHLFRSRVLNAGALARSKGTAEQVASVASMTVGWDIEAVLGPNLMLNEDAASFVHPVYDLWDNQFNYSVGERVRFGSYIYEALVGAYGDAQTPSGTTANNTWWKWLNGAADPTLIQPDGTVAGWESVSFTNGVSPGTASAMIGIGVQSATDASVSSANALLLTNKSASTADLGVRSAGMSLADPLNAITRGVPMPRVGAPWSVTTPYEVGALVTYNLLNYVCLSASTGVAPTGTTADNTQWRCLGVDDRINVTGSLYVKGGTGFQTLLAYPVLEFYDDYGARIATLDTSVDQSTNVFDGFSNRAGTIANRVTDVGSKTWVAQFGGYTVANGYLITTASSSQATIPGSANGLVSVTFNKAPAGSTQKQGVTFRGTTSASYLWATRTGLYTVSGGVSTLVSTYTTPMLDGDRMTVDFNGTAIKVLRNGSQIVLSTTSSFNTTGTLHGVMVS